MNKVERQLMECEIELDKIKGVLKEMRDKLTEIVGW